VREEKGEQRKEKRGARSAKERGKEEGGDRRFVMRRFRRRLRVTIPVWFICTIGAVLMDYGGWDEAVGDFFPERNAMNISCDDPGSRLAGVSLYVINLRSSPKRMVYMREQFRKIGVNIYKRVEASVPESDDVRDVERTCSERGLVGWAHTPETLANAHSHLKAVQMAVQDASTTGRDLALILEDDMDLSAICRWPTTLSKLASHAPPGWSMLQLGLSNAANLDPAGFGEGRYFRKFDREDWGLGGVLLNLTSPEVLKLSRVQFADLVALKPADPALANPGWCLPLFFALGGTKVYTSRLPLFLTPVSVSTRRDLASTIGHLERDTFHDHLAATERNAWAAYRWGQRAGSRDCAKKGLALDYPANPVAFPPPVDEQGECFLGVVVPATFKDNRLAYLNATLQSLLGGGDRIPGVRVTVLDVSLQEPAPRPTMLRDLPFPVTRVPSAAYYSVGMHQPCCFEKKSATFMTVVWETKLVVDFAYAMETARRGCSYAMFLAEDTPLVNRSWFTSVQTTLRDLARDKQTWAAVQFANSDPRLVGRLAHATGSYLAIPHNPNRGGEDLRLKWGNTAFLVRARDVPDMVASILSRSGTGPIDIILGHWLLERNVPNVIGPLLTAHVGTHSSRISMPHNVDDNVRAALCRAGERRDFLTLVKNTGKEIRVTSFGQIVRDESVPHDRRQGKRRPPSLLPSLRRSNLRQYESHEIKKAHRQYVG